MKVSNFFKDKNGKVVIAQFPNWPLVLAIIFWILKFPLGVIISLIYWSYLEIVSGVNTFRKTLGIIVLVLQLISLYLIVTGI